MNMSGTAFNHDGGVEPQSPHHHWVPSDDALSSEESSCSTVVTDSVDSDSFPSPFLLGGLQYLKRTDIGRQDKLDYINCIESDDSQSTNCSEFILDPSNRLKELSIKELETDRTNNQNFTRNVGNESPVISVVSDPISERHLSQSPIIRQHDLREGGFIGESLLMVTDNLPCRSENHLASGSYVVPSPDLFSGQDSSHIRRNTSWEIDSSGCAKNFGVGGDSEPPTDEIPSHSCSADIADVPVGKHDSNMDSKAQNPGRSIVSLQHQSVPSPRKIRKLSDGSERGSYLPDSLEDVTQVDGSACMFSDSSPVKSSSDHFLLPPTHGRDTGNSEGEIGSKQLQQHVEAKVATLDHQMTCESNDMPFRECRNTESHLFSQLELETSPQTQPSVSADVSANRSARSKHEARIEDVLKCKKSTRSVETERMEMRHSYSDVKDAAVTSSHTFIISSNPGRDSRVEMEKGERNTGSGHGHEDAENSVDEQLRSSEMNTSSTDKSKVAKLQDRAHKPKRGKQRMRPRQRVNKREKCSQIDGRQIGAVTRSQGQNAGIRGNDILIHERVLVLQMKLNKVKSGQDELAQSLSKSTKILKLEDVTNVGQQLRSIQTNLRQIAADVREVKTGLEQSLFDLRFVYSQKKRKNYVQQEMNSVLEIQQTLWTQLKAHREIASRLQEVIQEHTKEMKKIRTKEADLRTEKRNDLEESAGLTSSDGSAGSGCDGVTGASTTKESITEKQNTLLQQLLETLDECEGNLFVKFMSMLQGRETLETDMKKASQAESSSDIVEKGKGKIMKSVSMTSSAGEQDISADNRYEKRLSEIEEAEAGEISRGRHEMCPLSLSSLKQDRAGSDSKLTPCLDMSAEELHVVLDDVNSSSGDSAAGEFMSSDDDEMSVAPEPLCKPHESIQSKIPSTKGTVGGIKQVNPVGQVVPEDFLVSEGANSSFTNVQLSESMSNCASTSAVELASLSAIQKTVQVSTSQYINGNAVDSSGQRSASFRTPWKGLVSNTPRGTSRDEVTEIQQVPSSHPSVSASSCVDLTEGYSNNHGGDSTLPCVSTIKPKPEAKTQFKIIMVPKTISSRATQALPKSHVARHAAQTVQIVPGPIQVVSLKAVPLMQNTTRDRSTTPPLPIQPEQHHNKLSSQINSGSSCPAFRLECKESGKIRQDTSLPTAFPDIFSSEDPSTYDGKTGSEETYRGNCPSFRRPSPQRDASEQQPHQITGFPDMKLYKKIHLIAENELMPYTDVLPQDMWTADDISLVEMPRGFFDDIDSW